MSVSPPECCDLYCLFVLGDSLLTYTYPDLADLEKRCSHVGDCSFFASAKELFDDFFDCTDIVEL